MSNDDASNASYEVLPAVNCRNMPDPPTPSPPPNDFASLLKAVPSDNCQGRCAKDAEPVQSWARAGVAIARLAPVRLTRSRRVIGVLNLQLPRPLRHLRGSSIPCHPHFL